MFTLLIYLKKKFLIYLTFKRILKKCTLSDYNFFFQLTQHSNYNKVKQFFRCIEINYTKKNKPEILNRINNVLKKLATDSSYSVNQVCTFFFVQ